MSVGGYGTEGDHALRRVTGVRQWIRMGGGTDQGEKVNKQQTGKGS